MSWSIQHNKTLTYKHGRTLRDSIRTTTYDGDGKTPPGVSPPQERCTREEKKENRKQIALEADLSAAERGIEATVGNGFNQGKNTVSPVESAVLVQNGSPLPMQGLPGASQERPPSDASWPTDSHVGVSVDGKKHPRWSGSRELRAYLRRTGYGKVDAMTILEGKEPKQEVEERNGGRNIVKAIKRAGSFLNDGGKGEQGGKAGDDPWALHVVDMPGAATAAAADAHLNVPLGDLPVPPSPTNRSMPVVVPVSITTVRSSEVQMSAPRSTRSRSRSLSRSRSSSRSRSRPSIAPTDEPDDDDHQENPTVEHEPEQSKRYGKIKEPLLDGDDDSTSGAWVVTPGGEAPRATVMAMASAPERKTPAPSKRGKRGEGRPPKVSPSMTEDASVLQRRPSRERPELVDQPRVHISPEPARTYTPADGMHQSFGRNQDNQKYGVCEDGMVQRRPNRDRHDSDGGGDGDAAADTKTGGRAIATKSQPTPMSSSRERSRSRHKDREEFKGYRRGERGASETPVRDRDSRGLVSAESKGDVGIGKGEPSIENSRMTSIENSPVPRGPPNTESEAERRRRRAREETLNLQQHQGDEHRRERSKNGSKERNEDRRGDPPVYDPKWASRRQGKNVEPQGSTVVSQVDKHRGYDGQESRHLGERDSRAAPTVTDTVAGNEVPGVEDATATRPVRLSKTSSMMKFSNDPRAKLARDSMRKTRQQMHRSEGVDGT